MMADGRCCINFVRALVIIFNSIFALCGLVLVGIATWMLVDPDAGLAEITAMSESSSDLLLISIILLIAVGVLLFIISLLGIIGAVIEHKIVLGVFMACLIVIFLGEIAGGVLAIIFKDSLLDDLNKTLRDSLHNYYETGTCKRSDDGKRWDDLQKKLECCGIQAADRGYEKLNDSCPLNQDHKVPASCTTVARCTSGCKIWTEGCLKKVEDKITYYAPILIGIGIGVAMIQTIGIIFATCLCVNAPARSAGYKRHR